MTTRRPKPKPAVSSPPLETPAPARSHDAPEHGDEPKTHDVDEASEESFPASDPPAFTPVRVL